MLVKTQCYSHHVVFYYLQSINPVQNKKAVGNKKVQSERE